MNKLSQNYKLTNSSFFYILMLLLVVACAKKYDIDKLPPKQLHFGAGGGFSGVETDYMLLENGQIFMREGVGKPYQTLGKIKPKIARDFFAKAKVYENVQLNQPSNTYQYISVQIDSTSAPKRYVFSGGKMKIDSITKEIMNLHEELQKNLPEMQTSGRKD